MLLQAFRIQNYKKVRDTGWISCRDLTVLVGKNEAGKSAIFRALSKINPSDGEKYDGLKEFPRSRYVTEFKQRDWPAAGARFKLSELDQQSVAAIDPELDKVDTVTVTRHYSWELVVSFENAPKLPPTTLAELGTVLGQVIDQVRDLVAPEGQGDALGPVKERILAQLQQQRDPVKGNQPATTAMADAAINVIATNANEEWLQKLLKKPASPLHKFKDQIAAKEKRQAAEAWVAANLPQFVYFDRYDILESAVHIPTFLTQIQQSVSDPRRRVTLCLFKHVGLDLNEMLSLGVYSTGQAFNEGVRRSLDELAIKASSASTAMTQRFTDWWEQRTHKFRYDFQGEYFRVWVSDDIDSSDIELDQRSQGLQYFFSFYLVFIVEAEEAHANSILLLDEPGIHVHGTAQLKVVEFLAKLSGQNQVLYSTHSPFMIDANHLERARAVYEGRDGTTAVSEDVWPRDKDSLFPLQAALGYQLVQALFLSPRQLVVEGLTDFWLLKALDLALATQSLPRLRPDVIIVPSAGISKLLPLASMLIGHAIEIAALLDGDEPGRKEGKKLVDKLLSGNDRKCIFIGDFHPTNPQAELEDIFPEEQYLAAVREAYPAFDGKLSTSEKALPGLVDRVEAAFTRKGLGPLDKWRPAAILRDWFLADPSVLDPGTRDIVIKIFEAINELFESTDTQVP